MTTVTLEDSYFQFVQDPYENPPDEVVVPRVHGLCIRSHHSLSGGTAHPGRFSATEEELRTLAYQYLDRFYEFRIIAITTSYEVWESREADFAWKRFNEIAEVLSPGIQLPEFVHYITERTLEMARIERDHSAFRTASEAASADSSESLDRV